MKEALFSLADSLIGNASSVLSDFAVRPAFRLYWLWLLACVLLGTFSWWRYYRADQPFSLRRLFRFLVPAEVYFHPSAKVDYAVFAANGVFFRWVRMAGPIIASVTAVATARRLESWLGSSGDLFAWHALSVAVFTVCAALASDLAIYVVDAAHHRIPVLWEFHRVHHTAEVLTPFTVYRKHPLYDVFAYSARGLLAGVLQGIAAHVFIGRPELLTLLGINAVYAVFHAAGSNLRHSHVWLSFGPLLEHVLISPAQHQVHHSIAEHHWSKNYGEVFAVWDWMFGTLYVPSAREELHFGVKDAVGQEHPSLWAAYSVPFRNLARMLLLRSPR